MKVKEFFKKAWIKFKENGEDAGGMTVEFQDRHPFLFGFILGQVIVYWCMVVYGIFHPNMKLDWVKKQ